jgi:NAD(P)-dependent dehydrogenase (short-subunit alcohol dehydrogenase family)
MSADQIEQLLDANLRGAILGCKVVGKQMISRRQGGCIINVSSLLAMRGSTGTAVYAATKAGQLGMH